MDALRRSGVAWVRASTSSLRFRRCADTRIATHIARISGSLTRRLHRGLRPRRAPRSGARSPTTSAARYAMPIPRPAAFSGARSPTTSAARYAMPIPRPAAFSGARSPTTSAARYAMQTPWRAPRSGSRRRTQRRRRAITPGGLGRTIQEGATRVTVRIGGGHDDVFRDCSEAVGDSVAGKPGVVRGGCGRAACGVPTAVYRELRVWSIRPEDDQSAAEWKGTSAAQRQFR